MAVWASLVRRAQTVRSAEGGSWRERARSMLRLSTSHLADGGTAPGGGHPGRDRAAGGPDWSSVQPAASDDPSTTIDGHHQSEPSTGPGRETGRRSGSRSDRLGAEAATRTGNRSNRPARTDRADAGTVRTAPLHRARRWLRPPNAGRRGNGGSPGSTRAPTGPGPSPSSPPPAGRRGRGGTHPEAGIGLDVVAGQRAERGPGGQRAGADRTTSETACRRRSPGWARAASRARPHRLGLLGQDRLGQSGGQPDRRHVRTFLPRAAHGAQCRTGRVDHPRRPAPPGPSVVGQSNLTRW